MHEESEAQRPITDICCLWLTIASIVPQLGDHGSGIIVIPREYVPTLALQSASCFHGRECRQGLDSPPWMGWPVIEGQQQMCPGAQRLLACGHAAQGAPPLVCPAATAPCQHAAYGPYRLLTRHAAPGPHSCQPEQSEYRAEHLRLVVAALIAGVLTPCDPCHGIFLMTLCLDPQTRESRSALDATDYSPVAIMRSITTAAKQPGGDNQP